MQAEMPRFGFRRRMGALVTGMLADPGGAKPVVITGKPRRDGEGSS
jgi:hypothetical protein